MPAATNAAIPTRLSPEESSAAGRAQRAQSSSGLPPHQAWVGDICTHPGCSGKALYLAAGQFACAAHKGWIEVIAQRSSSTYCIQVMHSVRQAARHSLRIARGRA